MKRPLNNSNKEAKKEEYRELKKKRKEIIKLKKTDPEKYKVEIENFNYLGMRNANERLTQIIVLKEKLIEIGFTEHLTGFETFVEMAENFVVDGIRTVKTIDFREARGLELIVTLTPRKDEECSITVKNWGGYNPNA